MTAATFHHHVPVFFQNNIRAFIKIKYRDATQFSWRAAWLRHVEGRHEVRQGLHDRVVCGVHVRVQWEGAFAMAVKGSVTIRRYDPVLPSQISEADIQSSFLTSLSSEASSVKIPVDIVISKVLFQERIFLLLPGAPIFLLFPVGRPPE